MSIASFAHKVFEVNANKIYTFNNFQSASSLKIQKQDAAGKKPSSYNQGPDLDTIDFTITLDAGLGINPRAEWEDWKALMNKGVAYPFILGGVPLHNTKWLLINVRPRNPVVTNDGKIYSMELSLQFQEYVRAGSAKETSGTTGKVSISPALLLGDTQYSTTLGPEDKSEYKRDNPNISSYAKRYIE